MKEHQPEAQKLCEDEHQSDQAYRKPQVVFIGKAVDLIQGYNYGKRNDGYTGYYYES